MEHTPIVVVANHKGGVGKTTIAVRIAVEMASVGRRVLLIDLDPQGGATLLLHGHALGEGERGTYEALLGEAPLVDVAQSTPYGPDLVGASDLLARAELALAVEMGRENALRRALDEAPANRWDVVILDCPPSLGLLLVNALTAGSHVLVPVMPSLLSLAALRVFNEATTIAQKRLNPRLRMLGYVLNQTDARERALEEARELLRKHGAGDGLIGEVRVDARLRGMDGLKVKDRAGDDLAKLATDIARRIELPQL